MSQRWPAQGSQRARLLARLDIHKLADLVVHFPLRYEDETRLTAVRNADIGETAQIEANVVSREVTGPRRYLVATLRDTAGDVFYARWIHYYPSTIARLVIGRRFRFFGELRSGAYGSEMVHPRLSDVVEGEALPATLTPVYPTTAGLWQQTLMELVSLALATTPLDELLPEAIRLRLDLSEFSASVHTLHHPPPDVNVEALNTRAHSAWRRIKFEEILVQQLSLRRAYEARRAQSALALPARSERSCALFARLPFALTGAQVRAVQEIDADLGTPHPMQRLLLGDVGSGKTIVAALAMLRAAESGKQAVLMAPTEILAEQHFAKLVAWFAPLGLEVEWLTGGRKKRERTAAIERLRSGESLLAVGTHALIEDPVNLPQLALAVVDEQHRFGVRQRLALRDKVASGAHPHMLMMSATPIPRTLAMTHYADLDVSLLDELPPGRTPVRTHLASSVRRADVIHRLKQACLAGAQAYWVCPLVEESEVLQLQCAIETHQQLSQALPELKVGLIHGKLKSGEKAATMAAFVDGQTHVLVATTVIEVGVDVPRASLMVIEHAERFGLAQLHQLRGRVGRGSDASTCVLLYEKPLSQLARSRLKVIFKQTDGFAIASADLALRGPGEFIGARQSGVPLLRYADLELDADMIDPAREAAEELLASDPELAGQLIERWLGTREGLLRA